jgi:hypothetical protein
MTITSQISENLLSNYTSWTTTHLPISSNGSILHRRNYMIKISNQKQGQSDTLTIGW